MNTQTQIKTYYQVVVASGSTCCCRRRRHFDRDCGHKHRTAAAANRCRENLVGWKDGNCSATWYNSKVVEFDRKTGSEVTYDDTGAAVLVDDACTC